MKKKHLKKALNLILDNKAFFVYADPYTRDQSYVHLTDEMKEMLEKLRGKQKPTKLQEAVMTVIKEQKRRGEPVTSIPNFEHIPPPPPPPPARLLKEDEEPPEPPKPKVRPEEPRIRVIPEGGKARYQEL